MMRRSQRAFISKQHWIKHEAHLKHLFKNHLKDCWIKPVEPVAKGIEKKWTKMKFITSGDMFLRERIPEATCRLKPKHPDQCPPSEKNFEPCGSRKIKCVKGKCSNEKDEEKANDEEKPKSFHQQALHWIKHEAHLKHLFKNHMKETVGLKPVEPLAKGIEKKWTKLDVQNKWRQVSLYRRGSPEATCRLKTETS